MTTFNNKLSIFIPRVLSKWANEDSISIIFKKLDIGEVERVDFVEKKNQYNKIYYHAFVHFKEWRDTEISHNIQEKIFDPEQVAKIVYHVEHAVSIQSCYDDPKYWILLKNNNPMTANEVKQEKRIIELEQQNMNQNKIMLNYLNRVTNLETQLHQMQTTYWNSQMASMENSFNVRSPPLSPPPPPRPAPPAPPYGSRPSPRWVSGHPSRVISRQTRVQFPGPPEHPPSWSDGADLDGADTGICEALGQELMAKRVPYTNS